jgi:hypothetical protein
MNIRRMVYIVVSMSQNKKEDGEWEPGELTQIMGVFSSQQRAREYITARSMPAPYPYRYEIRDRKSVV